MNYEKIVKYFEDAAIFYRDYSNGEITANECDKAARVITELVDKIKQLEKEKAELLSYIGSVETRCDTIEKLIDKYQNEIVPGYIKRAKKAERALSLMKEE